MRAVQLMAAIPNLVLTGLNHQVTFVIFTGIILNFASRQVIISFILGVAELKVVKLQAIRHLSLTGLPN